jgi:hypothetical protein
MRGPEVLCKLGLEKAYELRVLVLFVKEMRIWVEMEGLDRVLYIHDAIFHSSKWNIVWTFF